MTIPLSEADIFTEGTTKVEAYLASIRSVLLEISAWQVAKAAKYIRQTNEARGTVFCAGNGGSQANAAHLSLHLQERGIRAIDMMGEAALVTALANDVTYEASLVKRLRLSASTTDLLVIFSGSGNSLNIIAALAEARRCGMKSIGFLGSGGGMARELCRVPVILQSREYGPIEDAHSVIVHMLANLLAAEHYNGGGPPLR